MLLSIESRRQFLDDAQQPVVDRGCLSRLSYDMQKRHPHAGPKPYYNTGEECEFWFEPKEVRPLMVRVRTRAFADVSPARGSMYWPTASPSPSQSWGLKVWGMRGADLSHQYFPTISLCRCGKSGEQSCLYRLFIEALWAVYPAQTEAWRCASPGKQLACVASDKQCMSLFALVMEPFEGRGVGCVTHSVTLEPNNDVSRTGSCRRFIGVREDKSIEDATQPDDLVRMYMAQQRRAVP